MIQINRIKKAYGERTVLDVSSLTFRKGETVVVIGPNGSGKSTLLKILSGIIKGEENDFSLKGKVLYLPQQSLPFRKTVENNILFSAEDKKNRAEKVKKALTELELIHLKDKNAKTLSGGECQRLALARVLVNDADFLILDEPSSAADIEGAEIMEKAIKDYKKRTGCGIIMTTHSPGQAKSFADRIIMLHNGTVLEDGSADEILENPKNKWSERFISQWKID